MAAPSRARKRASKPVALAPEQRAMLGFGARLLAGWIVALLLLMRIPVIERIAIDSTVAHLVLLARALGQKAYSVATSVFIGSESVQIVPDCTPVLSTIALWSAIVAFPSSWRWRAIGIAGGAVALWVFNLFRILALFPILRFRPEWFPFVHVYLWQTATVLAVIGLFVLWLRLQLRRASPP